MLPVNILFKVSGSIAAYKACHVISRLVQEGHQVQVVCSESALRFVGKATFEGLSGRPVYSGVFEEGNMMSHIHLARWADLVLLCPATANTINQMASGFGTDLLSTLFLAHDWTIPYMIAPAMNHAMLQHPATQASMAKLQSWGVKILDCDQGTLACGEQGEGKLLDPDLILKEVYASIQSKQVAQGKVVLITAGGCTEPIDGVRCISNFSSGATGAKIADEFLLQGAEVIFLHGQKSIVPKQACRKIPFGSFQDLDTQLQTLSKEADIMIHAAAVSDYSVAALELDGLTQGVCDEGKISSGSELTVRFRPNHKIIQRIRDYAQNPDLCLVGFKLTRTISKEERSQAVKRLQDSCNLDLLVHNDLHEINGEEHQSTVYSKEDIEKLCLTKSQLARYLVSKTLTIVKAKKSIALVR
ncbi:MAG: bifunctional phosphopantothenoylcysteine decarboxylase/phosphopantothenate--cysteine ligase CoaBC [Waddliaceae bacterium]|nr:bifunctional phosphopantothenoylcysteine decarboxylase/phosphopantothenate--cysteine ligase CoaBC [Waddliaceae bacterium]